MILALSAVNRTANWIRKNGDAPISTRPSSLAQTSAPGLCWAPQLIRRLDWERCSVAFLGLERIERSPVRPPGARAVGLAAAPGSFNSLPTILYFEELPSIRPSGRSSPNWSLGPIQFRDRGSRLQLEWIVPGLTALSFWIARTIRVSRWKALPVGLGRRGADPIESEQVFSGIPVDGRWTIRLPAAKHETKSELTLRCSSAF